LLYFWYLFGCFFLAVFFFLFFIFVSSALISLSFFPSSYFCVLLFCSDWWWCLVSMFLSLLSFLISSSFSFRVYRPIGVIIWFCNFNPFLPCFSLFCCFLFASLFTLMSLFFRRVGASYESVGRIEDLTQRF
jgi:hypothetical protein